MSACNRHAVKTDPWTLLDARAIQKEMPMQYAVTLP